MTRRRSVVLAGLVLVLAGCGGGGEPEGTKITFSEPTAEAESGRRGRRTLRAARRA